MDLQYNPGTGNPGTAAAGALDLNVNSIGGPVQNGYAAFTLRFIDNSDFTGDLASINSAATIILDVQFQANDIDTGTGNSQFSDAFGWNTDANLGAVPDTVGVSNPTALDIVPGLLGSNLDASFAYIPVDQRPDAVNSDPTDPAQPAHTVTLSYTDFDTGLFYWGWEGFRGGPNNGNGRQMFLRGDNLIQTSPVPEPSVYIAGSAGVSLIVLLGIRRMKKALAEAKAAV
ncbi:MAG: hypothetical protein ACFB21_02455 [Opitutales bacterium]